MTFQSDLFYCIADFYYRIWTGGGGSFGKRKNKKCKAGDAIFHFTSPNDFNNWLT